MRHEFPPKKTEPLFTKAENNGYHCQKNKDGSPEDGLLDEKGLITIRKGGHEVAPNITVEDIQPIENEQKNQEGHKETKRPTALWRPSKVANEASE
jgi:hypothetical protein